MHIPVFLEESLEHLLESPQGHYLDATFGRGGHAKGILSRLEPLGKLIACDRDPLALKSAELITQENFSMLHCNYSEVFDHSQETSLDGILADLGLCSGQLDQAERGFSFQSQGPLDMRMDSSQEQTLASFLAHIDKEDLANIIFRYGEERLSRRIADAIIQKRNQHKLKTTKDLAQCAVDAYPAGIPMKKHPATRTFQALRIALNKEFEHLEIFLDRAPLFLKNNGKLVIITFHSLEYSIVKEHFNKDIYKLRHGQSSFAMKKIIHPLIPTAEQQKFNRRARSARLHVYQKISTLK